MEASSRSYSGPVHPNRPTTATHRVALWLQPQSRWRTAARPAGGTAVPQRLERKRAPSVPLRCRPCRHLCQTAARRRRLDLAGPSHLPAAPPPRLGRCRARPRPESAPVRSSAPAVPAVPSQCRRLLPQPPPLPGAAAKGAAARWRWAPRAVAGRPEGCCRQAMCSCGALPCWLHPPARPARLLPLSLLLYRTGGPPPGVVMGRHPPPEDPPRLLPLPAPMAPRLLPSQARRRCCWCGCRLGQALCGCGAGSAGGRGGKGTLPRLAPPERQQLPRRPARLSACCKGRATRCLSTVWMNGERREP